MNDRDPLEGIDPHLLDWHHGALAGDLAVCGAEQPDRPGYPCVWNTSAHAEHRDVLGRTWPAHEEAEEELRVTTRRTVCVHTTDHGDITIPEPAWCTGHAGERSGYRIDITHTGPDINLDVPTSRGTPVLLRAAFEQRPFTEAPPGTGVFVNVEIDGDWHPCDPAGLHGLAAALVRHSGTVSFLAQQLAALRGEVQR